MHVLFVCMNVGVCVFYMSLCVCVVSSVVCVGLMFAGVFVCALIFEVIYVCVCAVCCRCDF